MLAGFKSRWMIPCAWAASTASVMFRDGQSFVERDRTLGNPIRERRAFDELENERRRIATVFDAVDMGDVRMVQRGENLGFTLKAGQPFPIVDERLG